MRIIAAIVVTGLLLAVTGCAQRKAKQARHDVAELKLALDLYLGEQGSYPQGTSAEICALLLGKGVRGQNPKGLSYIEASSRELNEKGEFTDPWGTPYRVLINSLPRVYSCGPNKTDENGTGDDITE